MQSKLAKAILVISIAPICVLEYGCEPRQGTGAGTQSVSYALDPRGPDETCESWPASAGFYKDMFVDGGYGSESFVPYAIEQLCLEADALLIDVSPNAGEEETQAAIQEQNSVMVGNPDDTNGVLLYPDSSPRYRLIFVNGSGFVSHPTSLGEEGLDRYRTFYNNGGSYTGSCAGAFLATRTDEYSQVQWLGIWPNKVATVNGWGNRHSIVFDDIEHPLVQKFPSLSEDGMAKYVKPGAPLFLKGFGNPPADTEWIGRVDITGHELGYLHYAKPEQVKRFQGGYVIIAHKKDENSGRLVLSAGHPEYTRGGEVQDLTAAIFLYALDGTRPIPRLKGNLESGIAVDMSGPESAVGDKQYHRWLIELPDGVSELTLSAQGLSHNVDLYLNPDCPAHRQRALYTAESPGAVGEEIVVENPAPGEWHLSVYGNHDHKNGAAYVLTAGWR